MLGEMDLWQIPTGNIDVRKVVFVESAQHGLVVASLVFLKVPTYFLIASG